MPDTMGSFLGWLCNDPGASRARSEDDAGRLDWPRLVPFAALHAGCLLVVETGVSAVAVAVAAALYVARMFFVTAFYHRYFSHRAFRASRPVQLAMAVLGCTAGQRGPVWWASHHREHHGTADTPRDPHSPRHRGWLFSHLLWFMTRGSFATREGRVRDWLRYPELRWLERLDWVPFLALAAGCYALGAWLERHAPTLGTDGPQMLAWGFFVSTVVLYHATYTINSLAHVWGTQRYSTGDDSRNNPVLALLTLGEGWHNNHHFYPAAARQGFFWWEIDLAYLALKALEAVGVLSGVKGVPPAVLAVGAGGPPPPAAARADDDGSMETAR